MVLAGESRGKRPAVHKVSPSAAGPVRALEMHQWRSGGEGNDC